jgi:lysophospholipase L1-like esterase
MSRRSTVTACLVTPSLLVLAVASPAAAATSSSTIDYVALGDSYSAGVGAPGQSGMCLRGTSGYPALWAADSDPASFRSVACSAATTDDVLLFQVGYLSRKTDLVTITIGGNDAGFAPAVVSCTLLGDAPCADTVADDVDYIRHVLPGRLDATYRAIRQHAPAAEVIVLSYPILFDTTAPSCGLGGMSPANRRVLNAGAEALDDVIGARAAAAGFTFADVRAAFGGHGICGPCPWLNGLTAVPPTNSFHPTATGYAQGYLPAFTGALA